MDGIDPTENTLPAALAEIRDEFLSLPVRERLQLLLEFANELPALPAEYGEHPERLERVTECQSPVFVTTEVEEGVVRVLAQAPAEAPTTRGFASILVQGLSGLTAQEVLDAPDDFPQTLGLAEAVSLLRLRGMSGMLGRIKRQVALRVA